jgi:uncharacterized protein (DUF2252 family)
MPRSVVDRIEKFNRGREPERLALKYRAMGESPFRFFRGTAHLFYEDWPRRAAWNRSPLAWICGDLHLENFGSFLGDNGLVYFDLNDFDEAVLAPATWEVGRLLASAYLATQELHLAPSFATLLGRTFLSAYREALRDGKARWVERATSRGMVRELLVQAKQRTQLEFLDAHTRVVDGRRRLRLRPGRTLPIPAREKQRLLLALRERGRETSDHRFDRVFDIARRVAGTGSLGIRRYIVLVRREGRRRETLLDLKEARPSALAPYLTARQPKWNSQAGRVVSIQKWVQAASPALLSAIRFDGGAFVARVLQPTEDRLDLSLLRGRARRLERVARTMGDLVAWAHLRSSGRLGSAPADDWIAFAARKDWERPLGQYARSYAGRVVRDWKAFRRSRLFEETARPKR